MNGRRRRWTLARRLSILFVGLLALVIGAFGAAAYGGVRESALQRASERLASVSRELAASSARSSAMRAMAISEITRDSLVRRAVEVPYVAPTDAGPSREVSATTKAPVRIRNAGLDDAIASYRTANDSTWLATQVWDAAQMQRHGPVMHGKDSAMMASAVSVALRSGLVSRSGIYAAEGQVRLWTAVPIRSGTRVIGAVAEQRKIAGNAATEGLIARLSGMDARVYIASRNSPDWASLLGKPIVSPLGTTPLEAVPDTGTILLNGAPAGPMFVAAAPVTGTPYRIVMMQTEESIVARPRLFLGELLLIGWVCLAAGAIGAWWLSKLETRPIGALRSAADAMAAGDYTQTVAPSGAEETAALADAFNTMAMHVSGVHATLADQNTSLREANEAKARFLAVMSHELRTPLNAISGHAELLSIGVYGDVTDAQREALDRITRNKDQLVALVSDILHYARQEANPLPVLREPVSLPRQFAALRETVGEQFERKGVSLVIEDTTASVCADPVRVQQVLLNLVTNALQFTPQGGTVTVAADAGADLTTLRVTDTGVGISAAQQATIFEPFVQADNSLTRRAGGAGLGLAIVRQLVAAMGGTVTVRSAEGRGSTFSVALPSVDATADAPSGASTMVSTAG